MTQTVFDYSVVIPVYNSEQSLRELAERLFAVAKKINCTFQLVLVNDGSTDKSWQVITELKTQYGENLRGINLARNFGQHNALSCGFLHSTGNAVITMDDDLQHPPEEIPKLVEVFKLHNADLVYGMYQRKGGFLRRMGSKRVKRDAIVTSEGFKGGSPFRLISAELVRSISKSHGNSFVYVDTILTWYTSNIRHVPVEHHLRKHGKTGYSIPRLFGLYWDLLINYTAVPLRWITIMGVISAQLAFGLGIYFIYRKIMYNVPLGYTSIIVAVLFGTGLILFSLGIIGQYLYKTYQVQYQKPVFHVQKII